MMGRRMRDAATTVTKTTTTNDDDDKHLKYYLFLFDCHYCYAMMIIGNVNSILKCDNKKNESIQTIY